MRSPRFEGRAVGRATTCSVSSAFAAGESSPRASTLLLVAQRRWRGPCLAKGAAQSHCRPRLRLKDPFALGVCHRFVSKVARRRMEAIRSARNHPTSLFVPLWHSHCLSLGTVAHPRAAQADRHRPGSLAARAPASVVPVFEEASLLALAASSASCALSVSISEPVPRPATTTSPADKSSGHEVAAVELFGVTIAPPTSNCARRRHGSA